MKKIKNKKEKGFVVLIAVVVSMILLSVGLFIANMANREISISSSSRDSIAAFYAADSAMECGLLKEVSDGYSITDNSNNSLKCNGLEYIHPTFNQSGDLTVILYKISFNESKLYYADRNSDAYKKAPFAILVIQKKQIFNDDGSPRTGVYDTKIEAYGYNHYESSRIVSRAIRVEI